MCVWKIISPKGCFPVISTPDAKNVPWIYLPMYLTVTVLLLVSRNICTMISSNQKSHVSNIVIWFRTFRFWLQRETWAGGYLRGLLSTPVRKFKVEIWRSLTDSYFCTNLQQLSNCWPAITLRIQVTVMLLKERYTLIRNFTMMTSFTLESINQCILHGLWHDCILSRLWYFVLLNRIPHLTITYFLFWFLFSSIVHVNFVDDTGA